MNRSHCGHREQLGAYALGQLSPEEARTVTAHLEGCAECAAELADITPVAGILARVHGRIDPTDVDGPVGPDVPPGPPPSVVLREGGHDGRRGAGPRAWMLVAAAAVAVALAGGGYGAGALGSAPAGEPIAVQAVAPSVRADAALIAHTWGTEITLDATGFDAGATYRVTVVDDEGRTVGAGEFVGTAGQRMRCNLNSSVLRPDLASFRVTAAADDAVVLTGRV